MCDRRQTGAALIKTWEANVTGTITRQATLRNAAALLEQLQDWKREAPSGSAGAVHVQFLVERLGRLQG